MVDTLLIKTIDDAFDNRDKITEETSGELREAVQEALRQLDSGEVRVA